MDIASRDIGKIGCEALSSGDRALAHSREIPKMLIECWRVVPEGGVAGVGHHQDLSVGQVSLVVLVFGDQGRRA